MRQPGYYWIQFKKTHQMTMGYYRGEYNGYKGWTIGGGLCVGEDQIYRIGEDKMSKPEQLPINPNYDSFFDAIKH